MSLFSTDKPSSESGHINVIAEMHAKAGQEDALRTLLSGLVEPSRKEKGCKSYHLLEAKHKPGQFFTYEEWTGEDVLATHLEGAKPKLDQAKTLVDGEMKITVLNHIV